PSGNEVGPFLPIEQAALSHVVPAKSRTRIFSWYTLAGSFATALGSLCGGLIPASAKSIVASPVAGYRAVVVLYALFGVVLTYLFSRLSPATEVADSEERTAKSLL